MKEKTLNTKKLCITISFKRIKGKVINQQLNWNVTSKLQRYQNWSEKCLCKECFFLFQNFNLKRPHLALFHSEKCTNFVAPFETKEISLLIEEIVLVFTSPLNA